MTRALVPLLTGIGLDAVSIGANGGSTPPDVPDIFRWQDVASGTELLAMFNWPNYGMWPQNAPVVVGKTALVLNWNGDNAGPKTAAAYLKTWAALSTAFNHLSPSLR